MPGALEGVRVLDCTQIIAGPLAGSLLSDMGADVVKIEPLEGEPWRLQAEVIPKESRAFLNQNRGKRGVALDLKNPASAPVRDALIRWADVLLTNYRPGVPEELGIDYDSARALHPEIIYCESTAFGKTGPDAGRRGYDIVAQAISGLTTSIPNVTNGLPLQVQFAPADVLTGMGMAWAPPAALFHRERTGEGQAINASLLLSALSIQAGFKEITALDTGPRAERLAVIEEARARGASVQELFDLRRSFSPELAGNVYYRPYKTSDGYIAVGCLGPGPRARFRKALGFEDPRYQEGFEGTPENLREVGGQLTAKCNAIFETRTTAEWVAYLDSRGIACGPIRFVEELWDDPQVIANRYIVEYEHAKLGPLRAAAPIVSMSATPTRVQRASPALGEHTDEVLLGLGFDVVSIGRWRAEGVIG